MDLLVNFPCLIPQNAEETIYEGFVQICEEEFFVRIDLPITKNLTELTFSCDWRLSQHLKGYKDILQQRLKQCSSLTVYLTEMKSLIERRIMAINKAQRSATNKVCGQLISDIEELGWEKLVSIDAAFKVLEFQFLDSKNRNHLIKVRLDAEYTKQPPQCIVDIPGRFDFQWKNSSTLESLYNQFVQSVELYQDFFDVMEELDKKTWVLEPESPTHSATYRRLAVCTNVSLQLTVDPRNPRKLPECRFLGASQVVNPLLQSMNKKLHLWDENEGLLKNLQCLLDVTFPSPSSSKKEEFSVECGICYSYRLATEIPNQACNDPRCGQPFHQTCLYEWLRSLSSRQSFNTVFGECPYCNKQITVKMPIT